MNRFHYNALYSFTTSFYCSLATPIPWYSKYALNYSFILLESTMSYKDIGGYTNIKEQLYKYIYWNMEKKEELAVFSIHCFVLNRNSIFICQLASYCMDLLAVEKHSLPIVLLENAISMSSTSKYLIFSLVYWCSPLFSSQSILVRPNAIFDSCFRLLDLLVPVWLFWMKLIFWHPNVLTRIRLMNWMIALWVHY